MVKDILSTTTQDVADDIIAQIPSGKSSLWCTKIDCWWKYSHDQFIYQIKIRLRFSRTILHFIATYSHVYCHEPWVYKFQSFNSMQHWKEWQDFFLMLSVNQMRKMLSFSSLILYPVVESSAYNSNSIPSCLFRWGVSWRRKSLVGLFNSLTRKIRPRETSICLTSIFFNIFNNNDLMNWTTSE